MRDRRPWFDLGDAAADSPAAAVIGLPFDGTASLRAGAALAPARLRALSRTCDPVTRRGTVVEGLRVLDAGDVSADDGSGRPPSQAAFLAAAARRLDALPPGAFVIALGGDNSVSIPAIARFARRFGPGAGVIWFDAHPDLFESYDGNPDSHACALRRALALGGLAPSRAVLLATRSFAVEEARFARENGVETITAAAWHAAGSERVAAAVADRLAGAPAVYLAVDIDGFDASCAPGTGYPLPGGVTAEAFFTLLESLFARLPVRAMDLTEIAPPLDVNDVTSFLGAQIVLETLGLLAAS